MNGLKELKKSVTLKTVRVMVLCPNCRSIRRAGEICPLCSCPVPAAKG